MAKAPQLTPQTMKVMEAVITEPGSSGADIARRSKLATGTLYPILMRLEGAGWLTSCWEDGAPAELGRPRRRFYRVTAEGARAVRQAAKEMQLVYGGVAWA
jgi:PadR family transcriptional regulator PadR